MNGYYNKRDKYGILCYNNYVIKLGLENFPLFNNFSRIINLLSATTNLSYNLMKNVNEVDIIKINFHSHFSSDVYQNL